MFMLPSSFSYSITGFFRNFRNQRNMVIKTIKISQNEKYLVLSFPTETLILAIEGEELGEIEQQ
jgi:diacylglycerol kinase